MSFALMTTSIIAHVFFVLQLNFSTKAWTLVKLNNYLETSIMKRVSIANIVLCVIVSISAELPLWYTIKFCIWVVIILELFFRLLSRKKLYNIMNHLPASWMRPISSFRPMLSKSMTITNREHSLIFSQGTLNENASLKTGLSVHLNIGVLRFSTLFSPNCSHTFTYGSVKWKAHL